jgi:hypothetical protein
MSRASIGQLIGGSGVLFLGYTGFQSTFFVAGRYCW